MNGLRFPSSNQLFISPAVLSFPLFLMLNGWLLGKRQAIGMAIATAALLFTLAALEQNGYQTWEARPSVWLLAGTTSAILGLGVLISTSMGNSIQTQYAELSELSRTLEQRVQDRTTELSAAVERLKQTQVDLVQSGKMAALGSLVAGISHELNTPLGNSLTVASTMEHQVKKFATTVPQGLTRSALDSFVAGIGEGADILMVSLRRRIGIKLQASCRGPDQREPAGIPVARNGQ